MVQALHIHLADADLPTSRLAEQMPPPKMAKIAKGGHHRDMAILGPRWRSSWLRKSAQVAGASDT
ncbi:MAG TPA: hypothetical protein VNA30_05570, partial [Mycobacteriales bacterium]|nr:hypothetical protein [Mycobacteriales bacterium]